MGLVDIVENHVPNVGQIPPFAGRTVRVHAFQPLDDGVRGRALLSNHLEHPPYQRHLVFVDKVAVPPLVVAEAVIGRSSGDDLAAPGFFELLGEGPSGYLGVLVLGEVVLYGAHQALLRRVLFLVLQGPQGAVVLAKLLFQYEGVAALSRYPVTLGSENEVHTAARDHSPHSVDARPPERVPLVAVVHHLCEDLVASLGCVFAELPELTR